MAVINLGVLNVASRVDLTGLNQGLTRVRTAISTAAQQFPAIGRAAQAAAAVASGAMAAMRGALGMAAVAVRSVTAAFGPLLALLAPAALIAGIFRSVKAFGVQEMAVNKLNAALGIAIQANSEMALSQEELSAKIAASSKESQEFASQLQRQTTFGDEAIIGVQAMLAALGKLEGEGLKKATVATADLAAGLGIDIKNAGDLVAKTLGSSTNALTRYGIQVEGAAGSTERLDSFVRNVAASFGGFAAAQAQTFTGRITQIKNVLGDASEALGKFVLMLLDVCGESAGVVDMLDRLRQRIENATQTAEFEQLAASVKEVFSAMGDVVRQANATLLSMFGLSQQTNNASAVLTGFVKASQTVVLGLRGVALAIALVQNYVQLLVTGWKIGMATLTSVGAVAALGVVGYLDAMAQGMQETADFFGASIGPVDRFRSSMRNLEVQIRRGAVESIDSANESVFDLSKTMSNAESQFGGVLSGFVNLTGAASSAGVRVKDFSEETKRAGGNAGALKDDLDETAQAAADAAKESKAAADALKEMQARLTAAGRATEAFGTSVLRLRERFSDMRLSITDEIALLEARNKTLNTAGEIDKLQASAAEERIRVEQRKADAIREASKAVEDANRSEQNARGAILEAKATGAPTEELDAALEGILAERARLEQQAAEQRVLIEQRAAAEILNINTVTNQTISEKLQAQTELNIERNRAAAEEAEKLAVEDRARQLKAIEEKEAQDLRRLEIERASRIADGESRAALEQEFQARRIAIVGEASVQIKAIESGTAEELARFNAIRLEREFELQEELIKLRQISNDFAIQARREQVEGLQSVIDTELLVVEDGEVRVRDILEGSKQKILQALVNAVNERVAAWIVAEQARVTATQAANAQIQASTAASSAIGAAAAFNPWVAAATVAVSLIGSAFMKSKQSIEESSKPIISAIQSTAKAGRFEQPQRIASVAQGVARDTGATNLIQQISFPVTISVQTQESDRIAEEVSRAVEMDVVPTLKREIATKEREAMLKSIATPRRLAIA